MNRKLSKVFSICFVLMMCFLASIGVGHVVGAVEAEEPIDFPDPVGYVNDFSGVLSNDDELDARLEEFASEESTQILVIVTDELPTGTDLETFVPRLTDRNPEWAAGQAEYDNGVIFTVVMDSREMRIDVGYGLEGAIPDITARHILDDEVKPHFAEDDYDGGVEAGVEAIMQAAQGEYSAEGLGGTTDEDNGIIGTFFTCCCAGFFIVIPYLGAYLGRTKSWWLGGVIGFIFSMVLSIIVAGAAGGLGAIRYASFIIFPPFFTIAGLIFDFIVSKTYKVRKKRGLSTGFFSSFGGFSSGGSSGFSGGSSGGFSSGGGSFGGGGSSSSW